MSLNQLNLIFGPKLPEELETVGLAFIAAPNLRPDSAIGALSAVRYAKQNYDHREENLAIFSEGAIGDKLDISLAIPAVTTAFSNPSLSGQVSLSSQEIITQDDWGFPVINSAIKVMGIQVSQADSWAPIIAPGTVWRAPYILAASGIEPSGSWIRRAIPEDGNDHTLILIYAVPEYAYTNTTSSALGLNFPPDPAKFKLLKEIGTAISPHKISFVGDIDTITQIRVNGTSKFNGTFSPGDTDTYIREFDKDAKTIDIYSSLAPDDIIELTYYSYNQFYVYTGYRNASGSWWPFDANPEFGHIIGDEESDSYKLSSEALIQQITLYAIPSAIIEIEYNSNAFGSEALGTINLTAYRAIDYGETHFIRHAISSEPTEEIESREGGAIINTFGYATFGRNFYNEQNSTGGDIFNSKIPSMIPLGRFVMAAPSSVKGVSFADIRQRGGGVPIDFPMSAVDTQQDGLDKLRGFFDLGIWEGKAIKEGGVVEIQIDASLLKTDENDTDPNTFLASEIYEIVRNQIPPGIDFEIKYVENL